MIHYDFDFDLNKIENTIILSIFDEHDNDNHNDNDNDDDDELNKNTNTIIPSIYDNKTFSNIIKINKSRQYDKNYGFIISRYVHSIKTNHYWNINVKQLRKLYPTKLIVIIDDNSIQQYLKPYKKYKNVIIIKSEYPGRAELLPYIYFAKYKWFDRAVIIHDGVFFHKKLPFEYIKSPCIPLWHFQKINNQDHLNNNIRISNSLNNANVIKSYLKNKSNHWIGCFGVQTFIKHSFLIHLMNKYNLNNLLKVVRVREDRCSLERIFAVILYIELKINTSILGNINKQFGTTFDEYINLRKKGYVKFPVVKVFTGR